MVSMRPCRWILRDVGAPGSFSGRSCSKPLPGCTIMKALVIILLREGLVAASELSDPRDHAPPRDDVALSPASEVGKKATHGRQTNGAL